MWSVLLITIMMAPTTELSGTDFTSLNAKSYHLIDPDQELDVASVLEEFRNNQIPQATTMSLGFDRATHWFAANVVNPHAERAWIFELEYPLLDYVDIYVVRGNGDVEHSTIGDKYPFSKRYFPSRFLHIPLGLEQNETITILWRITTQTSIIAGARIAPHDLWLPSRSQENQLKLTVYGVIVAIMFSQLILGFWTGDRSAVYVGSCAGAALITVISLDGMGAQLFSLLDVELRKSLVLISALSFGIFLLLTFHELFHLKRYSPSRSKITMLLISLNILLSISVLVFGYDTARYVALLALVGAVVLAEVLVWANRQGMRAAYVADVGLILMIVPPFLNSQRYAGFLENSQLLDNANPIGLGLGFIAFSLAVADKMLLQRRERKALLTGIIESQKALEDLEKAKVELASEHLSLQEEMKIASQKLTDADQMATLGIMMTGIIHDMNNPLQFISDLDQTYQEHHRSLENLLQELLGDEDGPEVQELRRVINHHFQALDQGTQDLKLGTSKLKALSVAMRNSARRDPSPGYHPLRAIVEESITILGSKLKLHTVSCNLPDNLMVYVTRSQLSQILINLISNARDATQKKYDQHSLVDYHPWIQVSAHETTLDDSKGITIHVEDNGDGVSPDNTEKIFEAFFTTKPVGVGTGLGLSIIKRLVSNHGGHLTVGSSSLGGAKFEIFLPARQDSETAVTQSESSQPDEVSKRA